MKHPWKRNLKQYRLRPGFKRFAAVIYFAPIAGMMLYAACQS